MTMRLIDADALKELILKERDAIPKTVAERYSFGVGMPNSHGNSMRGGIRKALRCMEQTPTIDPESLRPKGQWTVIEGDYWNEDVIYQCSECKEEFVSFDGTNLEKLWNYCPECGAKMEG